MNDYISIFISLIIFLFPYIGRKWLNIQQLSSIVVGMGLLGTFASIMYGIWFFSIDHIDFSIPQLLDSLKTALLTSIAGMISSLLLKTVPFFYGIKEKITEEISDKQILELLIHIEKNTRSTIPIELIQAIKMSNEQLQIFNDNFQDKTIHKPKLTTESILGCIPSEIVRLDTNGIQQQLYDILSALQETNKYIESLVNSDTSNVNQNHAFIEQMTSLGEFIKGSEQQMNLQLNRMDEKYEQKLIAIEKFTQTLTAIIKKLSQDHDTLYKKNK